MIETAQHERLAVGLMRAALTELAQAGRPEAAAHLHRAIAALASPITDGHELPPELAALIAAIPLPCPPGHAVRVAGS